MDGGCVNVPAFPTMVVTPAQCRTSRKENDANDLRGRCAAGVSPATVSRVFNGAERLGREGRARCARPPRRWRSPPTARRAPCACRAPRSSRWSSPTSRTPSSPRWPVASRTSPGGRLLRRAVQHRRRPREGGALPGHRGSSANMAGVILAAAGDHSDLERAARAQAAGRRGRPQPARRTTSTRSSSTTGPAGSRPPRALGRPGVPAHRLHHRAARRRDRDAARRRLARRGHRAQARRRRPVPRYADFRVDGGAQGHGGAARAARAAGRGVRGQQPDGRRCAAGAGRAGHAATGLRRGGLRRPAVHCRSRRSGITVVTCRPATWASPPPTCCSSGSTATTSRPARSCCATRSGPTPDRSGVPPAVPLAGLTMKSISEQRAAAWSAPSRSSASTSGRRAARACSSRSTAPIVGHRGARARGPPAAAGPGRDGRRRLVGRGRRADHRTARGRAPPTYARSASAAWARACW